MKKLLFTLSLLLIFTGLATAQKTLTVVSPNGKLKAEISIGDKIEYRVLHEADLMLDKSPVSLQLADGRVLGQKPKLLKSVKKAVNTSFDAVIYKKNKVADHYNELTLLFKGNFSVIFRAYDDGVAYRFSTDMKTPFEVENEQATFNFADNYKVFRTTGTEKTVLSKNNLQIHTRVITSISIFRNGINTALQCRQW